jgi:hypothetical protein
LNDEEERAAALTARRTVRAHGPARSDPLRHQGEAHPSTLRSSRGPGDPTRRSSPSRRGHMIVASCRSARGIRRRHDGIVAGVDGSSENRPLDTRWDLGLWRCRAPAVTWAA